MPNNNLNLLFHLMAYDKTEKNREIKIRTDDEALE